MVFHFRVVRNRDGEKYRGEHGKYQRLNKSHEYLQHEKRDGSAEWRQKSRDNQ